MQFVPVMIETSFLMSKQTIKLCNLDTTRLWEVPECYVPRGMKTPALYLHVIVLSMAKLHNMFTPVVFAYFMSSLYVQCRKWYFNGVNAISISWPNTMYPCFASNLWFE